MNKKSFPLSRVCGPLEPGPVVLVTTPGAGRPNIMTTYRHTMMNFEPPLAGCVISVCRRHKEKKHDLQGNKIRKPSRG